MTSTNQDIFGIGSGIYTIPDVSIILGLPPAKVRRWLNEYWNAQFGGSDKIFSEGLGKSLTTNFFTLIEFFTFYQLREEGVSTQKIVKAHKILEEVLGTKYPFAKSNILTDGKQILFTGQIGEIIRADETLQITIKHVFEPFCKKIDFNSHDLAERLYPMGKDHAIIIDPKRQFGQPLIGTTNILAETVYGLFQGGESIEVIVRLYDLSIAEVKDAINFYQNAA
ncbi:DUF433 domain-containing protein [Dyadobacter arcticus]|uniref:Uncharacterized protein (DUF433 family) n=1 Tax=Dyadobacter arcticus TaxID=1078754 RepID=A0ABX0UDY5_9BACT|nr:DUF433 domain-containing protein [Dyadobacter arcticus]NIJ51206.1 uncharacterized protein (DUF433 family) [Dyadobacter arcticus]